MTFTHALSTNNYGPAKFIVDSSSANGTHTTIASALTSASSGDTIFIRPGSYTEDLTLKAGVNLSAYSGDGDTPNVTIVGKSTMTTAGTVSISNIRLQTNSDFFLAVTGSAASIVNLFGCYINVSNNTGISFTTSSSSAAITLSNCYGDIGTTGIALFASSSAGTLNIRRCEILNSGNSVTASTISAGVLATAYTISEFIITTSGTAAMTDEYSAFGKGPLNTTALTAGGSGAHFVQKTIFTSGTASAISISTATFTASGIVVYSTNANPVTGAGTLIYDAIFLPQQAGVINTSTLTARNIIAGGISFDGGTNVLNVYTTGTYTPQITGSTGAGAPTYDATIFGRYTKVGNRVTIDHNVSWSALGGATGTLQASNLPFTCKNVNAAYQSVSVWREFGRALASGAGTIPIGHTINNSTTLGMASYNSTTGATTELAITATGGFAITMSYEV